MYQKLNSIIESYINGNIAWVKSEVKKLPKKQRKELYILANEICNHNEAIFFLNLI